MSYGYGETNEAGPTLANATILQIVPALREGPVARTALNVAHALLQWGARAMIAGEEGPLADELKAFGGEWIPLANDTINPFKLRRSARTLEELISGERVDIVHAQSAGGAWCAHMAASQIAVWLVTTLPDVPPPSRLKRFWASSLARGDRVIAPSSFVANVMMKRYRIPRERITVVPRGIDTATFDPAAVDSSRISALCTTWKIPDEARIVLTPGRVAPWNGQAMLPAVAQQLLDAGQRDVVFVLAGEHRSHKKYARAILAQAKAQGVLKMFRMTGHCRDMPAAFAAADVVAVPANEAPILGRVVARSAGDGPAGDHDRCRHPAGAHRVAARHARGRAHRLGGQARRCRGICARGCGALGARQQRLPGAVRARPPVRRIHVLAAERRGRDTRGLHVALGP